MKAKPKHIAKAEKDSAYRAELLYLSRRPAVIAAQRECDRDHAIDITPPIHHEGIRAAHDAGVQYRPWMLVCLRECHRLGVSFALIAERTEYGRLRTTATHIRDRAKVWTAMRDAGMSYPTIAACFDCCHSSVHATVNHTRAK